VSPEQLLGELDGRAAFVVADLEAGTGTVLRLKPGAADVALIVAQPTAKAIDVAARAARTARNRETRVVLVANRVGGDADVEAIRSAVPHDALVAVPDDPGVERADREGAAPIDAAPDGPAVRAVEALARELAG
jgi:CO dehydrogenase maturation factor